MIYRKAHADQSRPESLNLNSNAPPPHEYESIDSAVVQLVGGSRRRTSHLRIHSQRRRSVLLREVRGDERSAKCIRFDILMHPILLLVAMAITADIFSLCAELGGGKGSWGTFPPSTSADTQTADTQTHLCPENSQSVQLRPIDLSPGLSMTYLDNFGFFAEADMLKMEEYRMKSEGAGESWTNNQDSYKFKKDGAGGAGFYATFPFTTCQCGEGYFDSSTAFINQVMANELKTNSVPECNTVSKCPSMIHAHTYSRWFNSKTHDFSVHSSQ